MQRCDVLGFHQGVFGKEDGGVLHGSAGGAFFGRRRKMAASATAVLVSVMPMPA